MPAPPSSFTPAVPLTSTLAVPPSIDDAHAALHRQLAGRTGLDGHVAGALHLISPPVDFCSIAILPIGFIAPPSQTMCNSPLTHVERQLQLLRRRRRA